LQQAIDILERLRDGLIPTEQSKAASLADVRYFYEELIMVLFHFDRGRAFQIAESARARGFLDTLAESKIDLRLGLTASERERERTLTARISEAIRTLHRQTNSDSVRRQVSADLEAAEGEIERFRLEVRRSNPRLGDVQFPKPSGIEETRRALPAGTGS
jgi:hypothetical protein